MTQTDHLLPARPGITAWGRDRSGFSLVEVMIAVLVVAIGFVGTMSAMNYNHIQNDLEQERTRAHQIVCDQMEHVHHELYTRITGGQTVTVWDNGTPDNSADDTIGTLSITMRDPDGNAISATPVPAVRVEVEVTLTWNPRGRMYDHVMRETLMSYITP